MEGWTSEICYPLWYVVFRIIVTFVLILTLIHFLILEIDRMRTK